MSCPSRNIGGDAVSMDSLAVGGGSAQGSAPELIVQDNHPISENISANMWLILLLVLLRY